MTTGSPRREIVSHRREQAADGSTTYRMVVDTGETRELRVDDESTVDAPVLREFLWGPIPIVPEGADLDAAQEAYAGIHDRPLKVGKPFVTEAEYVALQVFEAVGALDAEMAPARAGRKLPGEGLVI